MIDRCNHGNVTWDGIREDTTATHGTAVGTCSECGAAVASSLSGVYAVAADDEDAETEAEVLLEAGHA